MNLHDWIILLLVAALVVYALGSVLIRAFFSAKRHYRQRAIREFMKGDEVS